MVRTRTTIFNGPKDLEVREIELPELGPGQVLVKVKACALCTWEQRFYKGSKPQDYPFRGGHEVAGELVEVAPGALCEASVGDRVAGAIMTRCGACEPCRRGMDNFCVNDTGGYLAGQAWGPGGLSDYILLEDYQVYRAAPNLDYAALALAEPVACVIRSVNLPPLVFGDAVMVQGVGTMGLLHVLLLKQRGVRVIVSEPDAARRQKSLACGADLACDPLAEDLQRVARDFTGGRGVKAAFFTSGGQPAIEAALGALAQAGWLCLYGSMHPSGQVQIDPNYVHYNELVVTGTFSHTKASFRQAVAMLSQRQLDLMPLVSQCVPFPNLDYGFERAMSPDTYRVVMMFD
jgi:L-iditol 2-dehydrogenase